MNVASLIKLKEGESVVRIVRNYWLVYFWPLLFASMLIAAPFFLMIPLFTLGAWGLGTFVVCIAAGALLAVREAVIWHWNSFIITTQRVVDIDQRGFFDRTVSEAAYEKIQDVSYRVKGMWCTLLNFGTVVIQTAGTSTNLELTNVRDPKEIHHLITQKMADRHGSGPAAASLVESAAGMSDAEARAFLVELQEKVNEGSDMRPEFKKKPLTDGGRNRHPLDPPDVTA